MEVPIASLVRWDAETGTRSDGEAGCRMTDLIRAWERVETWLRRHQCTSALSALCPPASDKAVQSLQDAIPYPLHPHLVQWLKIHGGAPLYDAPVWPGGFVPYDVEALQGGPAYMVEMLEEFEEAVTSSPPWPPGTDAASA